MSGSNETGERDSGTAPVPSAPPSFGRAEPPESAAQAPAGGTPAENEPLPVEIRLPIGLQKPWWADDDEPVPTAPEASPEASPEPEPEPEPETAPDVEVPLGTLVAGEGVPRVDTRRAVPNTPIVDRPGPSPRYSDTDPDGIPAIEADTVQQDTPKPKTAEAGAARSDTASSETVGSKATGSETTGAETAPEAARAEAARPETAQPKAAPEPAESEIAQSQTAPESVEFEAARPETAEAEAAQSEAATKTAEFETAQFEAAQPEAARETAGSETALPELAGPEGPRPAEATVTDLPQIKVISAELFLPHGTVPPQDPGTAPSTPMSVAAAAAKRAEEPPTVITPLYHAEGGLSIDGPQPPPTGPADFTPRPPGPGTTATGRGRGRRLLFVGGGLAAVVLIGIAGFALATGGSDSTGRTAGAAETPSASTPVPSQQTTQPGTPAPDGPSVIDNARTDTKPFALTEAFPTARVTLGGRLYGRDRSSVNHQCALAARGVMAQSLTKEQCSSIVRVTFIDEERVLAITSGIAVLPTKDAALRVNGAGDPSKYEWFRAMPGARSPNIDRAGGYAASTVRGRYIAYAYATYINGKSPQPNDTTLKTVAEQFVAYALRPIDTRARA